MFIVHIFRSVFFSVCLGLGSSFLLDVLLTHSLYLCKAVAEFIDSWQGDKINPGIGLSYRHPRLHGWRVGTTTLCRSWLYPSIRDLWNNIEIRLLEINSFEARSLRFRPPFLKPLSDPSCKVYSSSSTIIFQFLPSAVRPCTAALDLWSLHYVQKRHFHLTCTCALSLILPNASWCAYLPMSLMRIRAPGCGLRDFMRLRPETHLAQSPLPRILSYER